MGCRVCRARKVKCDGRPGGCRNCERLQLDCVGDDGSTSASGSGSQQSPVSLRKIRTYRSCTNCRLSKTKCNGDRPKCSRCLSKKIDCVYDGGSAPRWARNLDQASQAESTTGQRSPSAEGQTAHDDEQLPDFRPTPQLEPMDTLGDTPMTPHESIRDSQANVELRSIELSTPEAFTWLLSPELPATRHLRRLAEQYFANLHPLRCFAFVHKPTFMRQLDKGFQSDDENALLYMICAHGAKFHVLSLQQNDQALGSGLLRAAGNQWAKKAEYLMLTSFGKISIQRLMTAMLLHDFHFRMGEYSQALMISGLAVRMAQALKINTEYSADLLCNDSDQSAPSVVSRECRRRVMWACYVLDAWTGSGIDQLTLLRENDIKIQLPCNERNFGLRIACVTETLGVGHVLQFLPPAIVPRRPAANMGIMAYYIRIVALWKRVVRYVNNLDTGLAPWVPESEFSALDADLRLWRRELPDFVEYSPETIYARLDSNQLGGLVLIHCTYHHNFLELYKISMPDLFKLKKPFSFPPEHGEFLQSVQADCYYHALQISEILAEAAEHGARLLADSLLPFFVYDSSRVMLYYVARLLDPSRPDAQKIVKEAIRAVESNNRVLRMIAPLYSVAEALVRTHIVLKWGGHTNIMDQSTTIERWLLKINQTLGRPERRKSAHVGDFLSRDMDLSSNAATSPAPSASEFMLPPLSIQKLGRTRGNEKRISTGEEPSWSTENPNARTTWDHTSAAHQLVGLSQDSPLKPSFQHERPVSNHPQPIAINPSAAQPICETLDLDDLQNFLSWDMYGVMEMGDSMNPSVTDEEAGQSWTGTI